MDTHDIAVFGCWNNYKTVEGRIPMFDVINNLKDNEKNYKELMILGDNYYPQEKIKISTSSGDIKKVVFNVDQFNEGFNRLEQLEIPNKYLIMGNHDIEDTVLDDCIGLRKQIEKRPHFEIPFPYGSRDININGSIYKYIFIDSNLYNLVENPLTCFNKVLEGKSAKELLELQNIFIAEQLKTPNIKSFLVFAHEPLIGLKMKGSKAKSSLLDKTLMDILFSSGSNILYICADVHMYQYGVITNNMGKSIGQLVCGTGGADKDFCDMTCNEPIKKDNYTLQIINHNESYGYVKISLSDKIEHEYIRVKNSTKDSYERKYRIYYN